MIGLRVTSFALIASALMFGVACGGDDEVAASGNHQPDSGSGGSSGVGGSTFDGSGGTSAVGPDSGPGTDAGDAGCVYTGTPIDPSAFPECTLCQNARCVPTGLVPPETVAQLADCDSTSKCVPDEFIASNGKFVLDTCRSLDDAEGRCLSLCVPLVAEQAARLPQSTCAADERCAPCYDPTTGDLTGACNVSCDPGPTEPPVTFETCCGGLGSCVPVDLVPTDQRSSLDADTCSDPTRLCAPNSLVSGTPPPVCRSIANAEGRCVPACLPAVRSRASLLPTDGCGTGEVCAPCYDPITGDSTGACTINGDAPTEQPVTFALCCHDLGVCVPPEAVPPDQVSRLGVDTCTGTDELCAPKDLADSTFIPQVCTSLNNSEGRCLPDCLPEIAAQTLLPQDVCPQYYRCAPCYNPLGGAPTGACSLNGDSPTQAASTYPVCCGGSGSCLPPELYGGAGSLFTVDVCTGTGELCVPNFFGDGTYQPEPCDSLGGFEGRCLPPCLTIVSSRASTLPQSTCSSPDLCAPCFDPVTGADTFACRLFTDAPVEPPSTYEKCCNNLGTCLPSSSVSAELQPYLGQDTCSSATALCTPDQLANPSYIPPTCSSLAGAEGRCLPTCLPDIAAQASYLPKDTCADNFLCAPCYNPIDGSDTHACRYNGDAPTQAPTLFPGCCGSLGACVPSGLVPTSDQSFYGTDTCTGSGELCVPKDLGADPTLTPQLCASNGGFEGRCLPACLPSLAAQAGTLPQSSCPADYLCAPCYDPITSADTGACRLNGDAPTQPPGTFGKCCGGAGTCIPSNLVPADQSPLLSHDVCLNTGDLCVPDELLDASYIPPSCTSIAGAEGRCLATCMNISLPASYMPQATCTADQDCAPCYNPIDGTSTGACSINSDMPTQPAVVFPTCCSGNGICVPDSTLTSAQASNFPQLTCPSATWSCAPKAKVLNPTVRLPSCQASTLLFGFIPVDLGPGACENTCFITSSIVFTQSTCSSGQRCVACTEPAPPYGTGLSTGACD